MTTGPMPLSRGGGGGIVSYRTRVTMNHIPQIKAGMEQRSGQIVRKTALDLEAAMKRRVAVDTGFLKNSIQAVKIGRSHWKVTVGAHYGLYVEYGTRFNRAQPFFFPAISQVSPAFNEAMRRIAG